MRRVQKLLPHDVPGHCVFFGQVHADPEGFVVGDDIEPLGKLVSPAVSIQGLREAAVRHAGMTSLEDVAALREEIQVANDRIAELEQENDRLSDEADHIHGLKKHGYMIGRAPGRPSKKKETV